MSEYWKSTPKYWCKHCKTFVKDTAIEKKNHEATGKHQGNLQRFIRGLHKDNEREQRGKQRAKDEVNRLNGIPRSSVPTPDVTSSMNASVGSGNRNLTPADRKRQLQQLADMGIAVPEDFRRETAMASEWEVTSRRVIYEDKPEASGVKKEEGHKDQKDGPALSVGVRKRKHEDEEEEEALGSRAPRKGWGSSTRSMPGASGGDDLDALLNLTKPKIKDVQEDATRADTTSTPAVVSDDTGDQEQTEAAASASIKKENDQINPAGLNPTSSTDQSASDAATLQIKAEDTGAPPIIFKKRKPKHAR